MSGTERDVERARESATAARVRLAGTMGEILGRLNPRTLVNEAWQEVRERGEELADEMADIARSRPLAMSAILAATLAWFARRPLRSALISLFARPEETPAGDDGLIAGEAPPPVLKRPEKAPRHKEIA